MLNDAARQELIGIVRSALEAAVCGEDYTPPLPQAEGLDAACGCFVTLKTHERLRGCIGCFVANTPLYQTVAEYARLSACDDPRFAGDRLRVEELPQVALDISVLSPLEKTDQPASILLGMHGIYVRSGGRSGCFLPQVATETGWSVEEFWGNCCSHKAGLPADAWQSPETECFIFTAEVIESPALV